MHIPYLAYLTYVKSYMIYSDIDIYSCKQCMVKLYVVGQRTLLFRPVTLTFPYKPIILIAN